MDTVKIKIGYEKELNTVRFIVLEREGNDALSASHFYLDKIYIKGTVWNEIFSRLPIIASAVAHINGRKNVCSVDNDTGVLY